MTPEIRLECLRLAIQSLTLIGCAGEYDAVLKAAKAFEVFVQGDPQTTPERRAA